MWVFTTGGFVSAVQHRDDPEMLMVRARDKLALVCMVMSINTADETDGISEDNIYLEAGSDYRWRIVVSKEDFVKFMSVEVHDLLVYDNFKTALDTARGKKYHDAAMKVWVDMHDVTDYAENPMTDAEVEFEREDRKKYNGAWRTDWMRRD